jgi:hypothetical protein
MPNDFLENDSEAAKLEEGAVAFFETLQQASASGSKEVALTYG